MSTWAKHDVSCPDCGHAQQVPLLKGMHITRLPEARAAILDGTFQMFTCPDCDSAFGVERPTIYTDFESRVYLAMELDGQEDLAAQRAKHQKVFDDCFVFGPDVAAEIGQGMTCRLVVGLRALREKVLALHHSLDDRALEGVKLIVAGERDWDLTQRQLRLLAVHDGGHLLFGVYPLTRRDTPTQSRTVEHDQAIDHVTVPASTYQTVLGELPRMRGEAPFLFGPWIVDASLGALAAGR